MRYLQIIHLNRIRIASLNPDDIIFLKSRLISENTHLDFLHIFPLCQQVHLHNYKMQLRPDEQYLAKSYHYFSDNDETPHNPVRNNSFIPQDDRNAGGLPIQLNVSRGTRVMLLRKLNIQYGLVNGARDSVVRVHSNDNNVYTIDDAFDHSVNLPQALSSKNGTDCVNRVRQDLSLELVSQVTIAEQIYCLFFHQGYYHNAWAHSFRNSQRHCHYSINNT